MYHMRRKDKKIENDSEIKEILSNSEHVTVAMSLEDNPYLVTFNHGYDEENNCIYFHCALEGRKIEIWKKNPKVWGQSFLDLGYQKGICEHFYKTAQFEGTVSFIEDEQEKFEAMKYLIQQLEDEPDKVEELHFKTSTARLSGIRIGKIAITFLSGKIYNADNYVAP